MGSLMYLCNQCGRYAPNGVKTIDDNTIFYFCNDQCRNTYVLEWGLDWNEEREYRLCQKQLNSLKKAGEAPGKDNLIEALLEVQTIVDKNSFECEICHDIKPADDMVNHTMCSECNSDLIDKADADEDRYDRE